jgi:hypothetical protein
VITNKIESNHTNLAAATYWTLLQSDDNETDNKTKEANEIHNTPINETPKTNKGKRNS